MRLIAFIFALLPFPAIADIQKVIEKHVFPATDAFQMATERLSDAANKDCTAISLQPAYQSAFDTWMKLSHLSFGPLETEGRALAIEFWPDPRGMVARTVGGIIVDADAIVNDQTKFATVSIAGRGFMALEQILYDEKFSAYQNEDYTCRYAKAISADLHRMAKGIRADWRDHAKLMSNAGAENNTQYLSEREVSQTLYTALLTTLEFDADQRLGRPLGTFERPRPTRAEAYRSDRSLQNLILSLMALQDLAATMADHELPATETAFGTALATALSLDDPRLAGVADPQSRLKIEILQQQVRAVRDAVEAEIGGELGLSAGFNSRDGD